MARKRMIDPEFFLNEKLAEVSAEARLLYIGLWGLADDNHATLPNRPEWIRAQIFPYNKYNVQTLLSELESIGDIVKFVSEDNEYWYIPSFFKYQRVERPSKPKYPQFDDTHRALTEHSPSTHAEVKLSKEKLSKREPHIFIKPSIQEIQDYSKSIGFQNIDPSAFMDHYEKVGWVQGVARLPIKDWKACVRTWKRNCDKWTAQNPKSVEEELLEKRRKETLEHFGN